MNLIVIFLNMNYISSLITESLEMTRKQLSGDTSVLQNSAQGEARLTLELNPTHRPTRTLIEGHMANLAVAAAINLTEFRPDNRHGEPGLAAVLHRPGKPTRQFRPSNWSHANTVSHTVGDEAGENPLPLIGRIDFWKPPGMPHHTLRETVDQALVRGNRRIASSLICVEAPIQTSVGPVWNQVGVMATHSAVDPSAIGVRPIGESLPISGFSIFESPGAPDDLLKALSGLDSPGPEQLFELYSEQLGVPNQTLALAMRSYNVLARHHGLEPLAPSFSGLKDS